MKFAVVAALALAAVASAQNLQINDPTPSTVWTAGKTGYIRWTGVCTNLGRPAAENVKVQLVKGPENSVQFVADLGMINCLVAENNSITLPVPTEAQGSPLESGKYSLRFVLTPDQYSNAFTINAAAPVTPPPSGSNPSTPNPSSTPDKPTSSANTLVAGSAMALAGAVALQLLF
ncbi:hypothetical protein BGX24_009645 [Mortierella sp. AD032]|nr:hypothetical protein BGX24_009645 [Mortierella sp. AD032]